MNTKRSRRLLFQYILYTVLIFTVFHNLFINVHAAGATTAFGSTAYEVTMDGETFPIGVYLRADDIIGTYHLEIAYDASKLRYVSGAIVDNGGILTIEGVAGDITSKNFLYFQAIGSGNASINFVNAIAYNMDGSETYNITSLAGAPILINESATALKDEEEIAVEDDKVEISELEEELVDDSTDKVTPVEEPVVNNTIEVDSIEQEEFTEVDEAMVDTPSTNNVISVNEALPSDSGSYNNYDYLLIPFLIIFFSVIAAIGIIALVVNIRKKKYYEALNNEHIVYDFDFETFGDEVDTLTADEVENRINNAETSPAEVNETESKDSSREENKDSIQELVDAISGDMRYIDIEEKED